MIASGLDHLSHPLRRTDIAGIYAQAGSARLGGLDAAFVVEMDIGDDRDLGRLDDSRKGRGRLLVWTGYPDDVGAGLLELADLVDGRRRIAGDRIGHRLHGDRRIAADRHRADVNLARLAALDMAPRAEVGRILAGHVTHKIEPNRRRPKSALRD